MERAFAGSGRFIRAFKLPLLFHFSSVLLLSEGTMIDTWMDASPISAPEFSSHRPNNVQSSPNDIDATRRSNERSQCSNMHFPENCKSDPCVSLVVHLPARNSSRQTGCFFFFFFKSRKSRWLRIRVSLTNTRL